MPFVDRVGSNANVDARFIPVRSRGVNTISGNDFRAVVAIWRFLGIPA